MRITNLAAELHRERYNEDNYTNENDDRNWDDGGQLEGDLRTDQEKESDHDNWIKRLKSEEADTRAKLQADGYDELEIEDFMGIPF